MCVRILADTIFAGAVASNCPTGQCARDSREILVRVRATAAALDKSHAPVGKLEMLTVRNFPILMRSLSRSAAASCACVIYLIFV